MNMLKLPVILLILSNVVSCGGNDAPAKENIIIEEPAPENPVPSVCENVGCEDSNKVLIEQIYNDIINAGNVGLVSTLFNENVINHNTNIDDGSANLESFYTALTAENPNHVATIKHIVADGEYVAIHWHFSDTPNNEFTGTARVDLYKLTDNLIVEYWDNTMTPRTTSASGNSVFSDLYDYGSTLPNNDVAVEETNKTMVTDFYLDVFNDKTLNIIEELMDINYIQHNHWVETGRQPFYNFVSGRDAGGLTIFLSLAEDDLVWTFAGSGITNLKTIDLWRVDNNTNKIVEHWDVF